MHVPLSQFTMKYQPQNLKSLLCKQKIAFMMSWHSAWDLAQSQDQQQCWRHNGRQRESVTGTLRRGADLDADVIGVHTPLVQLLNRPEVAADFDFLRAVAIFSYGSQVSEFVDLKKDVEMANVTRRKKSWEKSEPWMWIFLFLCCDQPQTLTFSLTPIPDLTHNPNPNLSQP